MNKIIKFISSYIEDIFIFTGLLLLVITTYKVNVILSNYLLSAILIGLGVILSKRPPRPKTRTPTERG